MAPTAMALGTLSRRVGIGFLLWWYRISAKFTILCLFCQPILKRPHFHTGMKYRFILRMGSLPFLSLPAYLALKNAIFT